MTRPDSLSPRVSVVIPAYNRAHFIGDAVASILNQTLQDLELLVVDDGSTDDTVVVASSFADPRLRVISHERNLGIPLTRNTGLREARGKYIAWLDSDDMARPTRLQEQVDFLESHRQIAMVGCCAGKIGHDGRPKKGIRVPPLAPPDIGAWLLFRSAFQQSSVTGRADILKSYAYDKDYPVCEDLDVFLRLAETHSLQNMPRILIDRRLHPDQTIRLEQANIRDRKAKLFSKRLGTLGMTFSDDELHRHVLLGNPKGFTPDRDFMNWAEGWLHRMREANKRSLYLDPEGLRLTTSYFWMLACRASAPSLGRSTAAANLLKSSLAAGLFSSHGRGWAREALPLALPFRRQPK